MALDTSIYNNIQAPQMPDAMGAATKAMTLSQLGMQNQQMQLQLQTQQAMRQAYQNNRNPDGSMNREGMLSDLGRVNPQAAMEMQQHFVAQDKAQAEAQKSQAEAAHATLSLTVPVMQDLMTNTPSDQRATVWPNLRKQLVAQGVDPTKLPEQYDEGLFSHALYQGTRQKEYLDNALTQAGVGEKQSATAKNYAEIGKIQAETGNVEKSRATDYQKMLTGDEQYKKSMGTIYEGNKALTAIQDAIKNPGSAAAVPMTLARFTTEGQRMSNTEIEQHAMAGDWGDKFKQFFVKAKQGVLSPEMADYANQFVTSQMGSAAKNKSTIENDYAGKYAMDTGLPFKTAYSRLTAQVPGTVAETPAGPDRFAQKQGAPNQGGQSAQGQGAGVGLPGVRSANASESAPAAGMPSLADIRAELSRRKGKKGQ